MAACTLQQEFEVKVLVLGGDGFCGWPCAVNLADQGHDVLIVDNLSRRKIDVDLEVESLTPITSIGERLKAWEEIGGKPMRFVPMDIAHEYTCTQYVRHGAKKARNYANNFIFFHGLFRCQILLIIRVSCVNHSRQHLSVSTHCDVSPK